MKVSVELGDDVLRVVDELASRSGQPRDEVIAEAVRQQAVRQQAASTMLVGRDDGLSDDDAEAIVAAERNAMRAERRRDRQQGQPVAP